MASLLRVDFSGVQTAFSRIPSLRMSDRPNARGDIFFPSGLFPLNPRQPFVLDVWLGHIFTVGGQFRSRLFSNTSRDKNNRYRDPYHTCGISFAPLPVNTLLGVGPEVCHLLYRLAAFASAPVSSLSSVSLSQASDSSVAASDARARSVTYSHLLKEFQFAVACASLTRLRGRDAFISLDPLPPSSSSPSRSQRPPSPLPA